MYLARSCKREIHPNSDCDLRSCNILKSLVRPARVELAAFGFVVQRSIQLSYGRTHLRVMAERGGFEPPVHLLRAYIRLAGEPIRPLWHLSTHSGISFRKPGAENIYYLLFLFPYLFPVHYTWRREQDSNPRTFRLTVFKTAAIDHSAIPP